MKIYLDSCCFNRPFDDQKDTVIFEETQAKLEIQSLVKPTRAIRTRLKSLICGTFGRFLF